MFCLDEIDSLKTEELLAVFERMSINTKISTQLYRPEKYFWRITDILQDRLPSEIENTTDIERLKYLYSVAERLYRSDLQGIINNKIREIKNPPNFIR